MSLAKDIQNPSSASEKLSNTESEIIDGLFGVQDYKSVSVIGQSEDKQSGNLSILANGTIRCQWVDLTQYDL